MTEPRHLGWYAIASAGVAALVWACSGDDRSFAPAPDAGTTTKPAPTEEPGDEPRDSGSPDVPPVTDLVPTEPNLKVAFIGDTGTGDDFKEVLRLVKREKATFMMVQGDLNYATLGRAGPWFDVVDEELDIPYLLAKGNHDVDWAGYAEGLDTRMAKWGIVPTNGTPEKENYSAVYKGLKLVMVSDDETTPSRASYVQQELLSDKHAWKICSWHKNQRNANVGPKKDEMGWLIYENCRVAGAIVAQGHSHTYSRSKTITSDKDQKVDESCSDPFALCVGGGRHFFFDSSIGGQDIRPPETDIAALPHWGSTFTGSFGALFIEFNVGGDPHKAEGYFMTTTDTIIDPPAPSGKRRFTITRTP